MPPESNMGTPATETRKQNAFVWLISMLVELNTSNYSCALMSRSFKAIVATCCHLSINVPNHLIRGGTKTWRV
jgi:hypothetical protein